MGLYKRGKTWYGSIADSSGKIIRKSLSKDKQTAELILSHMRKQIALQKHGVLPMETLPALKSEVKSLRDIVREFLNTTGTRRSVSWGNSFDVVWQDMIERRKITDIELITPEVIQGWVKDKLNRGRKPQTINQQISLLAGFFHWSLKREYITKNPLIEWSKLKEVEKSFRRDLTADEANRILEAENDPDLKLLWYVYFFTGLRKSAGMALAWEWIDWEDVIINLPIKHNKSKKEHRIPIHPELFSRLKALREELGGNPSGHIIKQYSRDVVLNRFRIICRKAGVDTSGICLHSVRHTVATRLYESSGRNLKAVQEVLGHASINTTALYLHVSDSEKRLALESMTY